MSQLFHLLENGLNHAFIDREHPASSEWTPALVCNDFKEGQKVFCTLETELRRCNEFWFSVAFITEGGIQLFKPILKELKKRKIPGKIITTDYLCFSDPKALDFLDSFENIELRLLVSKQKGFHTKGYLFFHDDHVSMVVGSSNMTQNALLQNHEWNSLLYSTKDGSFYQSMRQQFALIEQSMNCYPYSQYREEYLEKYRFARVQRDLHVKEQFFNVPEHLVPNKMQTLFIRRLHELIDDGQKKSSSNLRYRDWKTIPHRSDPEKN